MSTGARYGPGTVCQAVHESRAASVCPGNLAAGQPATGTCQADPCPAQPGVLQGHLGAGVAAAAALPGHPHADSGIIMTAPQPSTSDNTEVPN